MLGDNVVGELMDAIKGNRRDKIAKEASEERRGKQERESVGAGSEPSWEVWDRGEERWKRQEIDVILFIYAFNELSGRSIMEHPTTMASPITLTDFSGSAQDYISLSTHAHIWRKRLISPKYIRCEDSAATIAASAPAVSAPGCNKKPDVPPSHANTSLRWQNRDISAPLRRRRQHDTSRVKCNQCCPWLS